MAADRHEGVAAIGQEEYDREKRIYARGYAAGAAGGTELIYTEIARERLRQDTLKAEGRFRYTLADEPGLDDGEKLAALLEEVAEVGKAMLGERMLVQDGGNKRKELIEVAAMAVAWVEGIDAWKGRRSR